MSQLPVKMDKVGLVCIFDAVFLFKKKRKKCLIFKNIAEDFAKTISSIKSPTLFFH